MLHTSATCRADAASNPCVGAYAGSSGLLGRSNQLPANPALCDSLMRAVRLSHETSHVYGDAQRSPASATGPVGDIWCGEHLLTMARARTVTCFGVCTRICMHTTASDHSVEHTRGCMNSSLLPVCCLLGVLCQVGTLYHVRALATLMERDSVCCTCKHGGRLRTRKSFLPCDFK